jgi:diguanylate cyclase (GGDEF)-like protein
MAFVANLINSSRLSTSILIRILLFSGLFTLTITTIQLGIDYKTRLNEATQEAARTASLFSASLGRAIWELNTPALKDNARSLFKAGYYSYIEVVEDLNSSLISIGKRQTNAQETIVVLLPFTYKDKANNDKVVNAGELLYQIDIQRVEQKVINDLYLILISQFIKTFLVSIFILYILHKTIICHINEIVSWLERFNTETPFVPMVKKTKNTNDNEMLKLKSTINSMGLNVYRGTNELEKLVEQRTTELEQANLALKQLAYTDSLTGIANRVAFFEKADEELRRSRRLSYDLGLIMLDLDHFKSINDTYGHDAGDKVLKLVTESMQGCLREEDTIGRLGGEEFAIIVPGANKQGMHKLATRIQASLELNDFSFLDQEKKVTVSIGYTKVNTGELFKTALKRADQHLYTAKNSGRNNFVTDNEFLYQVVN